MHLSEACLVTLAGVPEVGSYSVTYDTYEAGTVEGRSLAPEVAAIARSSGVLFSLEPKVDITIYFEHSLYPKARPVWTTPPDLIPAKVNTISFNVSRMHSLLP